MITKNAQGQLIRVHSYAGPMRKHGSDRPQSSPERDALDALSRIARTTYRGVIRRPASSLDR